MCVLVSLAVACKATSRKSTYYSYIKVFLFFFQYKSHYAIEVILELMITLSLISECCDNSLVPPSNERNYFSLWAGRKYWEIYLICYFKQIKEIIYGSIKMGKWHMWLLTSEMGWKVAFFFKWVSLASLSLIKRTTTREWFQQKSHHSPSFLTPTHVTITIQRAGLLKSYTSENFDLSPKFCSIAFLMLRLSTHQEPSLALQFLTLPRSFILLELPFIQPTSLVFGESLKG